MLSKKKKIKRYGTGKVLSNAIYNFFGNFNLNIEEVKLPRQNSL